MITRCQGPPARQHRAPSRTQIGRRIEPIAGVLVAGRYRLLEQVGRGATSTVWRADDERLDRDVAVKQLGSHLPGSPVSGAGEDPFRPDGLAEARIAARVRHPNVATVHDVLDSPSPARHAGPLRPLLTWLLVKDPAGRPSHAAIHTLLAAARPAASRPDC